jgi:hypothetical protein
VVDVSDPANPTEAGRYDYIWRPVGDVAATGGWVTVAAGGAVLLILRLTGSEPVPARGSTIYPSPSPASGPPSTPQPRPDLCLGSALLLPLLLLPQSLSTPPQTREKGL